ncbi:transposase [Actinomadura madurae]|nr:transposase [Actinomadura madurae]URM94608.1 transposase [Actinomadura madurae]
MLNRGITADLHDNVRDCSGVPDRLLCTGLAAAHDLAVNDGAGRRHVEHGEDDLGEGVVKTLQAGPKAHPAVLVDGRESSGRSCPPRRPGRPSKRTRRQLIDGIRRRVRTGAPGRDVPDCHGSWQAVYGPFRRRQRGGAPQRSAVAGTRPRAAVRSFPG